MSASTTAAAPAREPERIHAIPVRYPGRWVSAVVVLVLAAMVASALITNDNFAWPTVGEYLFSPQILRGVRWTIWLTVASMAIAIVLAVLLAIMRRSGNPVMRYVAWVYIWFFRGTPVLVQLFVWFNLGLVFEYINLGPFYRDEWSDFMTPFLTALLGLGLNEAAYMAEICRAGLLAVDEGQTEAAHALGMSHTKTLRRIVVPQAMRVIVPPTGNEVINMLKTTSLVSVVQYAELFRVAQDIGQTSGAPAEMLFLAAAWYLLLTSVFSVGQYYLERYYARGSSRSLPPTPMQKIRANLFSLSNRSSTTGGAA